MAVVALTSVGCTSAPEESEVRVISYNVRYLNNKDTGDNHWDNRKQASICLLYTSPSPRD